MDIYDRLYLDKNITQNEEQIDIVRWYDGFECIGSLSTACCKSVFVLIIQFNPIINRYDKFKVISRQIFARIRLYYELFYYEKPLLCSVKTYTMCTVLNLTFDNLESHNLNHLNSYFTYVSKTSIWNHIDIYQLHLLGSINSCNSCSYVSFCKYIHGIQRKKQTISNESINRNPCYCSILYFNSLLDKHGLLLIWISINILDTGIWGLFYSSTC